MWEVETTLTVASAWILITSAVTTFGLTLSRRCEVINSAVVHPKRAKAFAGSKSAHVAHSNKLSDALRQAPTSSRERDFNFISPVSMFTSVCDAVYRSISILSLFLTRQIHQRHRIGLRLSICVWNVVICMTMEVEVVSGIGSVICLMKMFKVPLESRQKLLTIIATVMWCRRTWDGAVKGKSVILPLRVSENLQTWNSIRTVIFSTQLFTSREKKAPMIAKQDAEKFQL